MTTHAGKPYALITGGTSGIGFELAKLFAKDGYNLVIVARSNQELENTAAAFKSEFQADVVKIAKDLFNPDNAFEVYEEVSKKGIQVDVLVNDAGQGLYGKFVDTDIKRDLEIIRLNISSVVVLTKLFLKEMVERGNGKILNLSSVASQFPGPFQSVYHGTKAFIQSFTEAIRDEVRDSGVTITALLPGATDTDFFDKADMENSKIVHEGKLADPATVAKDGYDALMKGDDKVISGTKNKIKVAMSNFVPESKAAQMVHKQQEPEEKK